MDNLKNIVNYELFQAELHNAATAAGFIVTVLGKADGEPILFLSKQNEASTAQDKKNVLIAAGFHAGTEPAGQWGIIKWLRDWGSTSFENVNISILPLVNPNGFKFGTREDSIDDDPNRGWIKDPVQHASKEGIVLINHIQELYDASTDGFITLHENLGDTYFVISIDEKGILSEKLRLAGGMFFKTEHKLKPKDDTFEIFLHKLGVPIVVVSESPAKQPISERIECNCYIVKEFIEYYNRMEWNT